MKNVVNRAFMTKKRILFYTLLAVLLAACQKSQTLEERAAELCAYIPDHELLEKSRDYMTPDFYAVLDTMFYRLPQHEAMDHEYNYWFVTDDGTPLAITPCEVQRVEQQDATHAQATICDNHILSMELINGQWLLSDFDDHKADCIRYIANNRKEQAVRQAISDYLLREIAPYYLQGELCVPALLIAHEEDSCVWGDFWVFWYKVEGDTLKTVSGGSHPGMMTLTYANNQPQVIDFERVEDGSRFMPTAKRIFGDYLDIFMNMHANESVREAVRREQLTEYVQQNGLNVHYYQDFGWEAKELEL